MDALWAPWRIDFILGEKAKGCFFCRYLGEPEANDRANLVVERLERSFVLLNRYPYNNGHLMIAPHRHTGSLADLDDATALEMWRAAATWTERMRTAMRAEGFNVGFNLGRAAGAGVDDHVHLHVVPRWNGDTNFMPVLGDTKVISQSLDACWELLRAAR